MASAAAMASYTHFFICCSNSKFVHPIVKHRVRLSPSFLPITNTPPYPQPQSLQLRPLLSRGPVISRSSSSSSSQLVPQTEHEILSGSTRTLATILAMALSLLKLFQKTPLIPGPEQRNLLCTMGPLFFASLRDRPTGYLNTPLTVVAAGLAKWLDIYSGVLMVRVLLSWFPNIPWERQPLSAIRDLCDPYLNLFRNIIPPVFDTLDVSPLLAFAVLGVLGSILHGSRMG